MAKEKTTKKEVAQCGNCAFGQGTDIKNYDIKIIACRRLPPTQEENRQTPGPFPFPMVNETEWCGEHKPIKSKKKD